MIDPRARQVLEDDLIKFLRETHKAGSAYHRPGPHDPTVYINLPAEPVELEGELEGSAATIDVTGLAEAILDGRVRANG
jgi:hypothetical protein